MNLWVNFPQYPFTPYICPEHLADYLTILSLFEILKSFQERQEQQEPRGFWVRAKALDKVSSFRYTINKLIKRVADKPIERSIDLTGLCLYNLHYAL